MGDTKEKGKLTKDDLQDGALPSDEPAKLEPTPERAREEKLRQEREATKR